MFAGPGYIQEINSPVDSGQHLRNNLAIEDSTLRGRSPSPGVNRIEYHYANTTTTNNRDTTPLYSNEKVTAYRDQDTNREYSPQSKLSFLLSIIIDKSDLISSKQFYKFNN